MNKPRRKKEYESSFWGCFTLITLVVFLTPIAGIFLLTKKDPDKKIWGWFLLVTGLIMWIIYACIFSS
jgi:multisubunit Na+/H+ antiporter MnhC subunit